MSEYLCTKPWAQRHDYPKYCTHEACRPDGRISDELKRMYAHQKEKGAAKEPEQMDQPVIPQHQTLGEAQNILIKAINRIQEAQESINFHRETIADHEKAIERREEELRTWGARAKEALPLVAMGFHMTVKDDLNA